MGEGKSVDVFFCEEIELVFEFTLTIPSPEVKTPCLINSLFGRRCPEMRDG
jgi:hypothetical protein